MRAMWCPGVQYCSHAFCTTHQCTILSQTLVRYTVYASSVCRIHVSSEGIHYPRTYIHIHLHPHVSTLVKLRFQFRPHCVIWLQKAVPGAILDHRIVTHVFEGVKQYIYSTKCVSSVFCGRHLHQCCSWSHPISTNCDTCVWSCKAIYLQYKSESSAFCGRHLHQCCSWSHPEISGLHQILIKGQESSREFLSEIFGHQHIAMIYHRKTNTSSKHKSKPTMTR